MLGLATLEGVGAPNAGDHAPPTWKGDAGESLVPLRREGVASGVTGV